MAKTKHTADPSALTRRVWVIEERDKGSLFGEWVASDIFPETKPEWEVVNYCRLMSEHFTDCDHRYRAAALTFDDDGTKCVIY